MKKAIRIIEAIFAVYGIYSLIFNFGIAILDMKKNGRSYDEEVEWVSGNICDLFRK